MATTLPATHLRAGEARPIAAREVRCIDLDRAEHRRIEQLRRAASFVLDPAELHVTDGADGEGRVVATIDRDRRRLRGQPFCDQAAQDLAGTALLAGEDCLEFLFLARVGRVVNVDPDGTVTRGDRTES